LRPGPKWRFHPVQQCRDQLVGELTVNRKVVRHVNDLERPGVSGWIWLTVCTMDSAPARLRTESALPRMTNTGAFTFCQTSPRFNPCCVAADKRQPDYRSAPPGRSHQRLVYSGCCATTCPGVIPFVKVQIVKVRKSFDRGVHLGRRLPRSPQPAALCSNLCPYHLRPRSDRR
jgi:hypothetical protein